MANLDQANAYCLLGDIYRFGNGIQKNINMAMQWYQKVAEKGHSDAQCNLGHMSFGYDFFT